MSGRVEAEFGRYADTLFPSMKGTKWIVYDSKTQTVKLSFPKYRLVWKGPSNPGLFVYDKGSYMQLALQGYCDILKNKRFDKVPSVSVHVKDVDKLRQSSWYHTITSTHPLSDLNKLWTKFWQLYCNYAGPFDTSSASRLAVEIQGLDGVFLVVTGSNHILSLINEFAQCEGTSATTKVLLDVTLPICRAVGDLTETLLKEIFLRVDRWPSLRLAILTVLAKIGLKKDEMFGSPNYYRERLLLTQDQRDRITEYNALCTNSVHRLDLDPEVREYAFDAQDVRGSVIAALNDIQQRFLAKSWITIKQIFPADLLTMFAQQSHIWAKTFVEDDSLRNMMLGVLSTFKCSHIAWVLSQWLVYIPSSSVRLTLLNDVFTSNWVTGMHYTQKDLNIDALVADSLEPKLLVPHLQFTKIAGSPSLIRSDANIRRRCRAAAVVTLHLWVARRGYEEFFLVMMICQYAWGSVAKKRRRKESK